MASNVTKPSATSDLVVSFTTIPTDVRCSIALLTVSLARVIPNFRDLETVSSLVLTCRLLYEELAMRHNSDLYAKIFRLMFDVAPVKRRLGTAAVTSPILALELKERVKLLKKIRTHFTLPKGQAGRWDTMLPTFNRAVLMMLENDGKNRHQLLDVAQTAGVQELLALRETTGDNTPNPDLAVFVALTELGRSETDLIHESSDRRFTIIDLLQPFVLSESWSNISNVDLVQHRASIATIEYFGHRCRFRTASLTLLARLCTVGRYKALKKIYNVGSGWTCILSKTPPSSIRFDNDWSWYLTVDHTPLSYGEVGPLRSNGYALGTFNDVWEGQLYITSTISHSFTCALPMQSILREFVSICAADTVTFEGGEDDDDAQLARGWFPEGVMFEDNISSINIYDPVKSRWFTYTSASNIMESSDTVEELVVFDTILIGNTDQAHGARHGEYTFHGRVRPSGRVALVRQPADPRMMDLGTWVFHGQLHVGAEFIGDWRTTSTEKYTHAVRGWFQMSKDPHF